MADTDQTIESGNSILKAVAQAVLVLIVLLLAGAVIFYKERMLFIDAPHVLFRIINDGHFQIEEHRYGSFISQMFPLLGAKLHLPFSWLIILYSASFYLFYFAVALCLVYIFRSYRLAILFGLYLTLFISDTYYWPNNEIHQGVGWLLFAFAANYFIAEKKKPLIFALIFFVASFYLAIWTHPLVMVLAIYLWFFQWLDGKDWPYSKWQSAIFTFIILLLSYFKFSQGMHHGYDSTKIEVLTHFHPSKAKEILASPMLHFFVKNCFYNYWLFVLLFIAGIAGLVKEKKYLLLTLTILFATGYLLLVCISFWDLNSGRFYIESEYMPLSIICCAPFVYFVLPKLNRNAAIITITLVFSIRLVYIYNAAPPFTNRIAIIEKIIGKMKEKKLTKVIIPEPIPGVDSALITNWGAPVESIILSKLNGETPQRTFIFLAHDQVNSALATGKDTLLACWEKRGPIQVNSYYFQPDTTIPYLVVSYSYLMQ